MKFSLFFYLVLFLVIFTVFHQVVLAGTSSDEETESDEGEKKMKGQPVISTKIDKKYYDLTWFENPNQLIGPLSFYRGKVLPESAVWCLQGYRYQANKGKDSVIMTKRNVQIIGQDFLDKELGSPLTDVYSFFETGDEKTRGYYDTPKVIETKKLQSILTIKAVTVADSIMSIKDPLITAYGPFYMGDAGLVPVEIGKEKINPGENWDPKRFSLHPKTPIFCLFETDRVIYLVKLDRVPNFPMRSIVYLHMNYDQLALASIKEIYNLRKRSGEKKLLSGPFKVKTKDDLKSVNIHIRNTYGPFYIDWDSQFVSAVKIENAPAVFDNAGYTSLDVGRTFVSISQVDKSPRDNTFYCVSEVEEKNKKVAYIYKETVVLEDLQNPLLIVPTEDKSVLNYQIVPALIKENHPLIIEKYRNAKGSSDLSGSTGIEFPYLFTPTGMASLGEKPPGFYYPPNGDELKEMKLEYKGSTPVPTKPKLYSLFRINKGYTFYDLPLQPSTNLHPSQPVAKEIFAVDSNSSPDDIPKSYPGTFGPFIIDLSNELVPAIPKNQETQLVNNLNDGDELPANLAARKWIYYIYIEQGTGHLFVKESKTVPEGLKKPSLLLPFLDQKHIQEKVVPELLKYRDDDTVLLAKASEIEVLPPKEADIKGFQCTSFPLVRLQLQDGEHSYFYKPEQCDLNDVGYRSIIGKEIPNALSLFGYFQNDESHVSGRFFTLKSVPLVQPFEKSLPSPKSTSKPEDLSPPEEEEKSILTSYQQDEYNTRHATMGAIARAMYDRDQYMNPNFLSVSSSPESIDSPLVIIMNWIAQLVYIILAGSGVCLLIGGVSQLNLKSIIGIGVIVRFILFSMSLLVRSTRTEKHFQNRLAKLPKKN